VPLTRPLPAVTDVDIDVPEGGASPFFSSTALQLSDVDDAASSAGLGRRRAGTGLRDGSGGSDRGNCEKGNEDFDEQPP
jgi:hypothetical protein